MTLTSPDWATALATRTHGDVGDEIARIMGLTGSSVITLSGGFPDPATFPDAGELGALVARVAADPSALQYAPTAGLPRFRSWLSDRLAALEGLRPDDGEFMVCSGGIEGLELIAKTLLDPGDLVLVEGPTYLGAIMAFRSYQAEVVSIGVDGDGLDVEAVADLLARRPAKLLYTIPDHANPSGLSMATQRRQALVELARRHGLLVVEDVAYRELSFDPGERRPSLWSLGPDVVAQLGTFSKTFAPGFRMGWVAAPRALLVQLIMAKQNTDQCTGALGQALLAEYGAGGELDRRLVGSRALYRRRCDRMLAALERELPGGFSWTVPAGGFFTWVTGPAGLDTAALYDRALAAGVAFVPGTPFYPDGRGRHELRLSFSKVTDEQIDEGVRVLGAVLKEAVA